MYCNKPPNLGEHRISLTNDVPQCDDVIFARGRQAEWRRFPAAPAVVVGIKWFDVMLPFGKTAKRRDGSFSLRPLGRQDTLRTGTANAINLRRVGQCGFLMVLVPRGHDGRLAMRPDSFYSRVVAVLPV